MSNRTGRSYRGLVGAAAGEVDELVRQASGPHQCPSCGHQWTGSSAPADTPLSGVPFRTPEGRDVRRHQLEPAQHRLASRLASDVARDLFDVWLAPCWLADATHETLVVAAPRGLAPWVRDRFRRPLAAAARALAGRPMTVHVITREPSAAGRTFGDDAGPPPTRRPDGEPAACTVDAPPEAP